MMRVFEFQDQTNIRGYVLAQDQDDATEIFEEHALARGGDPDALLWREWSIAALPDPERSAVLEALALNREGVVSCENLNRWVFIVPLGIRA
jgi:hypothetical protein